MVGRILLAEPIAVSTVECTAEDGRSLYPCNGKGARLPEIAPHLERDEGTSGDTVRRLIESDDPVQGPIVLVAQIDEVEPAHILGPIVIYDGMHRAAAWHLHSERLARSYSINGYLIGTKNPVSIR